MEKILYLSEEYNAKTSWNDINMRDFEEIVSIKEHNHESDIKILTILTDIPKNILYNSTEESLKKLMDMFNFLYKFPDIEMENQITHKGRTFQCVHPIENETIMKWIMLDVYVLSEKEILEAINNNKKEGFVRLLATTLHEVPNDNGIPLKWGVFSTDTIEEKINFFDDIDIITALSYSKFFFSLLKNYKNNSLSFSDKHIKVLMRLAGLGQIYKDTAGLIKSTSLAGATS